MTNFDAPTIEANSKIDQIQPPVRYGTDEQIAALVRRVRFMIPGASEAPDAIIWKACQLATLHRLDIFSGDIWIYPAYKGATDPDQWIVDVGVAAWRRSAQRQALYTCQFFELSEEECKERIGAEWTPEDVGFRCDLYRLDTAREAKALGIPYTPVSGYGFWRKRSRKKRNGDYVTDELAHTETKADKAQKRAEKKALKAAYHLDYPDEQPIGLDSASEWRVIDQMNEQATKEEFYRQPVIRAEPRREADGDLLWA